MAYVELTDLAKSYGGRPALAGFRLGVERGELVSLLGPSGCGKTTTLRLVAGFEWPDAGDIRVDGRSLLEVAPHRRGVGMVFQSYALFPHLTARGNVAFGMKVAGRPAEAVRRRVAELLELVGLADAGGKYPRQLSGGQQQRVALARALAIEPRLLLLDEPLSALDAVVRVALREEIRRIQSSLGVTTLYVTHDQEEALAISDRVVVMRAGGIEQIGPPAAIYSEPATRFVAGFIGKMNQLPGVVETPDRGRVRCGPHRLTVPAPAVAGRAAGEAVVVLVRPEAITVAPAGTPAPGGANALPATVELVTFLGSIRRLSLDAGGRRVVADVSTAARVEAGRGTAVVLTFPAEACRVIADETGAAGVPAWS